MFLLFKEFKNIFLLIMLTIQKKTLMKKKCSYVSQKRMINKISFIFFVIFLYLFNCSKPIEIDLEQIKERGKLIAITGYSANSYFIYKGQPMGYEFELLSRLAIELNLELEIELAKSMDTIFDELNAGRGDIIAHNLTVTKTRQEFVNFAFHHNEVKQVLVQRKPEDWRKMKLHEIDRKLLLSPIDLIGKTVHVRKNSAYVERILNLSNEIGGDIHIVEIPGDASTDELIRQVSDGEIEFTIADENIAKINQTYYTNLDVRTPVSLPQRVAWAVRKNSPLLLDAVNSWIKKMKKETDYYVIYDKYFDNRFGFRRRISSDYFSQTGGGISEYDSLIKVNAEKINWDWRLLASMIYQESEFLPDKKSWAGAVGLMQLVPRTGREFGAINLNDPYQNVEAGTNFIQWLKNYWKEIPDSTEKMNFILASYNVGQGHVQDARKLADKYGKDPNIWNDNVAYFLLHKSDKKFYDDEVVQFGYCRGEEPVNYVREVFERYSHYTKFID